MLTKKKVKMLVALAAIGLVCDMGYTRIYGRQAGGPHGVQVSEELSFDAFAASPMKQIPAALHAAQSTASPVAEAVVARLPPSPPPMMLAGTGGRAAALPPPSPPRPPRPPLSSAAAAAPPPPPQHSAQPLASEVDMWGVYPTMSMKNDYIGPPPGKKGVGSWTQGWNVEYDRKTFESEQKLEVYVLPHSHHDPGWKETYTEWYDQKTGPVLDALLEVLQHDKRWRFQWSEVAFLKLWWQKTPDKHEVLKGLVASGQLELVGGGIVMNDEALTTLFAIVENLSEGRSWM